MNRSIVPQSRQIGNDGGGNAGGAGLQGGGHALGCSDGPLRARIAEAHYSVPPDPNGPPRYLTKSRFKLALECPTKLAYTGRADYADVSQEDSFLMSLAEGGYQVGALACLMYPGGTLIDAPDHASQLMQTAQLLMQQEEVTLYEAALASHGMFIRVDILIKRGGVIELLEVKAKSWKPGTAFYGARGAVKPEFAPYLYDVAFQTHVAELALPGHAIHPSLVLANTEAVATVDGLNQKFRVRRMGRRIDIDLAPGTDAGTLGAPLLVQVPVGVEVADLRSRPFPGPWRKTSCRPDGLPSPGPSFADAVAHLATAYNSDFALTSPPSKACANCQFRTPGFPQPGGLRSGFHECWQTAFAPVFAGGEEDFAGGTVLDLHNFRKKDALIAQGVVKLAQVSAEDLGFSDEPLDEQGMSTARRQWYQVSKAWPGGPGIRGDAATSSRYWIDREGFAWATRDWKFPLHMIDFETSAVAIPFHAGKRPYETVAFQFSHHVLERDGRVRHADQFLLAEPGVDPSWPFLRALQLALDQDDGTVLRWSHHENTVLLQLRERLLSDTAPPPDQAALVAFIDTLTVRKAAKGSMAGPTDIVHVGGRAMVDLCDLAKRYYFHPDTQGSSSLKKVLPALVKSSGHLRAIYGQPVYGTSAMPSLNVQAPMAWWVERDGEVQDPYALLPALFADPGKGALNEDADDDGVREGGAAMAAYGRLQFEDLAPEARTAIQQSLLRYCELDTLAMVMAVQAWSAEMSISPVRRSTQSA